jgi:hypothetical protein
MSDNLLSNKYVLLIATILSVIMLAASMVPSLFLSTAFAASDDDDDVVVDPTIQVSIELDENIIDVDPGITLSVGCGDINNDDKVTQVNEQTTNQEVHKNNDVGDGGVVVEPTIQASVQTAVNINVDSDVLIVLGCFDGNVEISDDDKVTQVNEQTVSQEVHKNNDVGDGGMLVSPTIQKATSTALNYNAENDRVVFITHPKLVTRSPGCVLNINDDDDKVTQVNEQTVNQEVLSDSEVGDGGMLFSPTIQKATSTALNYNADKDVVIVLGCNYESVDRSDDDKVTQVNEQTADQEVLSDSEVGDGGLILSPTIQKATSTALNYNADNDHVLIPLPNL